MDSMEKLALTPKEAAKVLRVGVNRIYELCHMADFPCITVGSRFVIPVDKLHDWMNTQAAERRVIQ